jgi:response regulator RpfG family c-di-GMP phosphodiesterase
MKQTINKKSHRFILLDDDLYALAEAEKVIRKISPRTAIFTFSTATEAIKYMATEDFNRKDTDTVLLTDLHMLETDGFAFMDRMENTFKMMRDRLHVFILAAAACPGDIKRALSYTYVIGLLSKPFSRDKIGQIIDCIHYPL